MKHIVKSSHKILWMKDYTTVLSENERIFRQRRNIFLIEWIFTKIWKSRWAAEQLSSFVIKVERSPTWNSTNFSTSTEKFLVGQPEWYRNWLTSKIVCKKNSASAANEIQFNYISASVVRNFIADVSNLSAIVRWLEFPSFRRCAPSIVHFFFSSAVAQNGLFCYGIG